MYDDVLRLPQALGRSTYDFTTPTRMPPEVGYDHYRTAQLYNTFETPRVMICRPISDRAVSDAEGLKPSTWAFGYSQQTDKQTGHAACYFASESNAKYSGQRVCISVGLCLVRLLAQYISKLHQI